MPVECRQYPTLPVASIRNPAIDMSPQLAAGELMTGTPTVTESGSSDLTISSVAVSTTTLTILGDSVAAGKAIQWSMSGMVAGTEYTLIVEGDTDASPTQHLVVRCRFDAEAA